MPIHNQFVKQITILISSREFNTPKFSQRLRVSTYLSPALLNPLFVKHAVHRSNIERARGFKRDVVARIAQSSEQGMTLFCASGSPPVTQTDGPGI